jgi:hypothetical protein
MRFLTTVVFGPTPRRLTKARIEAFFAADRNFHPPRRVKRR